MQAVNTTSSERYYLPLTVSSLARNAVLKSWSTNKIKPLFKVGKLNSHKLSVYAGSRSLEQSGNWRSVAALI